MDGLVRFSLARPWWVVGLTLILTILVGTGIPRLQLRTDGAALHPTQHPVVSHSQHDAARFRDGNQVVIVLHADSGFENPAGLRSLRDFVNELRRQPAIQGSDVVSVATLARIDDDGMGISLGSMLDRIPDDPGEFASLVQRLRTSPLVNGLLLSVDGSTAAVYAPVLETKRVYEHVRDLQRWLDGRPSDGLSIWLTGPAAAEASLGDLVLDDLFRLVPLVGAVVAILLVVTLACWGGLVVPLIEAALVLTWVLGIMGWMSIPVTLVTTILPVLLMAMAITDEIHLLERVQARAVQPGPRPEAIATAVAEVRTPIVATSVTTALGFLSFSTASVEPLRQFGWLTASGILLAMLFSFCVIPALILLLPSSWFRSWHTSKTAAPLDGLARSCANHPRLAAGIALGLVAIAALGLTRLEVQDAWVDNFPPDSDLVRGERALNEFFWGSYRFDVVMEGEPDFFFAPDGVALVDRLERTLAMAPHVGGIVSYLVSLREIENNLGSSRPLVELDPYELGDLVTVVGMSENQRSLQQLVTDDGSAVRLRLFVNSPNYLRARELEFAVRRELAEVDLSWHLSGDLPTANAVVESIVQNQVRSIGWTVVTVFVVLGLGWARGRSAFIVMVPVLATAVTLVGAMGYAKMPLGIATSMFASITVGLGVDFSLHVWHAYRRHRTRLDHRSSVEASLAQAGKAIRWNSAVLTLGFLVLLFSGVRPNHDLGLLLASSILGCYLATLAFLPLLLRHTVRP